MAISNEINKWNIMTSENGVKKKAKAIISSIIKYNDNHNATNNVISIVINDNDKQ